MKNIHVLSLSILLAATTGFAQQKVVKNPDNTYKTGGTYRETTFQDPKTFNPFVAKETSSTVVIGNFLSGLVNYDPYTQEIVPDLAESYQISNNGRTIVFKIRKNVKWSDGKPFTADDVMFSATVHADAKVNSNSRSGFEVNGKPVQWKKVDANTVRADFPTTYAPALLQSWPIAPKHIFEDAYKAGKLTELWGVGSDVKDLVGTGAFLLTRYVKGERLEYTANPNYYAKDQKGNDVPYLKSRVTQIVTDQNAEMAKFLGGESDAYGIPDGDKVAALKAKIKDGLDATVYPNQGATTGTNFVVFNFTHQDTAKSNLYRQTKFRQAIAYLMNKADMVEIAQGGLGVPQWSPITLGTRFHSNVKTYEYSPQKAQKLLAELGYTKKNAQGVLVNAKNEPLTFNFYTNQGNNVREKIAQIFTEDAKKVGVDVKYRALDFNDMVRRLTTPDDKGNRDFDAILIGLTGGLEPASGKNTWELNGPLHMWNLGGKNSPAWDILQAKLFQQAYSTLDSAKRKALYKQWQDVVAENLPVIYTIAPAYNPAFNNRLGGLFEKKDVNPFFGAFPQIDTVFINK